MPRTLAENPIAVRDPGGYALSFIPGGGAARVLTPVTAHATQRTYAAWLYIVGAGGGNNGRVFDKRTAGAQVEVWYDNWANNRITYTRTFSGGVGEWYVQRTIGGWHHFVWTYDASSPSNVPKCYVDGVEVTVTTVTSGSGTANTNTDAYVIGNRTTDLARNFNGYVDDFRIYDRILTAAEALAMYRGQSVDTTSLVLQYLFNEGSGSSATDNSGNANTGTITSATYVTGIVPSMVTPVVSFDSFLYNGVNQYADIPDNAAYSIPTTGLLTVSVWLKRYTDNFTLYEGSGYANVLGKSDFGSPNHVEWQMRLYNLTNTEGDMRGNENSFYVFNTTGGLGVSSDCARETTDVNRWVHYLATMDGTYVRLYKDGVLQEVANYIATITPADTIAKIYVAHADNNGYFYGEVGPIKIWKRVLSQSEVLRQYNFNESNTNGLVGHWLADNANNRLTDQTATANHGTLRNSPTFVPATANMVRKLSRNRRTVYTKQRVNFNGTTQYATIADASQVGLDVNDRDFLITGWVKFDLLNAVQTIFAKVDTGHTNAGQAGAIGYDCIFNTSSGGTITFRTRSAAAGNQTASFKCPTDGKPHHIALVFKRGSSGRCQIWLDGVRVVNFSSFTADMGNDGVFRMGASSGSGISQFLKGSLFAWHFYTWAAGTMPDDYQRIIDDVLYRKQTTYTNGLVSVWKFDGDLTDSYGPNNLTGTATPTFSAGTGRTLAS